MLKSNWVIFNDKNILSESLAKDVLKNAEQSISDKGCFSIVLAGGNSSIELYKILKESSSDWSKWNVYMGDDRHLLKNDKERNDHIIEQVWLNGSLIPKNNIFFIKAELGMSDAKKDYESTLKEIEKFDVVLLSMGEDGHTASLFPGHEYVESDDVVLEYNSPKPPSERVSMSYSRLNKAKNVFKIIMGNSKQEAVSLWLQGEKLPINQINGDNEKVYICKDALAEDFLLLVN
ncbi:6-phosphogluconolactonase [Candidatus Woesearchaeota archaeon]|nr:6-phosphogluconolactonase [Candidatus Woesearchaeota archaeon]MBT7558018.1 6-phosphogluconolactonase [Candidatus Woesearchaeota archaeon]